MDKDKSDVSGDYLIWKQLLEEAASRKLPVVFITDDRKEDWYWLIHGRTIGARYELREEMTTEAGVPFLIMSTETFLLHAKEYLQVSVSRATVDQAKEIQEAEIQAAVARARRAAQEQYVARLRERVRMLRQTYSQLSNERSAIEAQIAFVTGEITADAGAGNDEERFKLQMRRDNLLRSLGAVDASLSETQRALEDSLSEVNGLVGGS